MVTRYEYNHLQDLVQDSVADTPPDQDDGLHIRGPVYPGVEEPDEGLQVPTRRLTFGRRANDLKTEHIITKKLVVVTVILVDALYLAGDALLNGQNICP